MRSQSRRGEGGTLEDNCAQRVRKSNRLNSSESRMLAAPLFAKAKRAIGMELRQDDTRRAHSIWKRGKKRKEKW